jgi:hypothetical protein
MSAIPEYNGLANPFSTPIEALTSAKAVGIRNCESMFHLASTIVGGRDLIEEFVAANIWPIFMAGLP